MKKLNIIEGIKSSLPDLINRSQDIFFNNYGELVGRVFTPGFFVKRKTDGTFEDDFKPSVTTESSANIIQVSITGRNPAYCYVAGGKILTLNDIIKIDPREIDGYYNYNTVGSVNSVNITYELWVVPQEVEQDPVDYLPQYQDNKQSKNLTVNYLVGFLLIKKGSTPPIIINPSVQERTSNTPVTTTRNIPSTVEGLKLAEFTYNESTTTITNLQDLRGSSRAYLQPTLYDFFDSLFLKHDFILAHAEDSAGANSLVFAKNGTGNPKLTGRFLLVGAKEKVTTFLSKITVTASAVEIPINSIIYINLTDVEYYSQTNITKTLQVQSINDFTPNRDKLVLGYHLRTYLDGGNNPEEIESGLDVIDTTGTSTVNDEQSVIYFVNGLPPLPPGQSISREGIPSYVLTKDEAVSAYYNKTQSNNRFIKSGNDDLTLNEELFRTQTFMTYDSTKDSSEKYSGIKILDSTVPFNKRLGWVIRNSAGVPIGSLSRVSVDANTNYLELILSNDNGANLKAIRINQNGNVTVEGANPFPGDSSGDQNKFIT